MFRQRDHYLFFKRGEVWGSGRVLNVNRNLITISGDYKKLIRLFAWIVATDKQSVSQNIVEVNGAYFRKFLQIFFYMRLLRFRPIICQSEYFNKDSFLMNLLWGCFLCINIFGLLHVYEIELKMKERRVKAF